MAENVITQNSNPLDMGENKLDRIFQEKLKNLQETPDERVWSEISDSLDKRKKSKVVPIWWKLGGVAAVLAIGLFAIIQFSNTSEGDAIITDLEQIEPVQDDGLNESKTRILKDKENKGQNTPVVQDTPDRIVVADEPKRNAGNYVTTPKNNQNLPISLEKAAKVASGQKNDAPKNKPEITTNLTEKALANVGYKEKNRIPEIEKTTITTDESIVVTGKGLNVIDEVQDENTLNAQNGLAESAPTKNEEKLMVPAKDSIIKKSLFDEIADQEQLEVVEAHRKKWSAGPNIAPVYFNAFGEGSPVHSIFVPNTKSGQTNLSYGLSIAYEISNRLSLRSGINKVDYGYDTSDVEFTSSLAGSVNGQIDHIDYALTSRNLVVQSKAGAMAVSVNSAPETKAMDVSAKSAARDGNMSQQFGYLEVPLELNYALVDRKVGLNLIGGFSSLFLVDNAVNLTSGNQTMEMGEANNINSVNFSTNVGFGIDYKFSPKIKLNLEPIFKYQLNTFSNVDGTFQPFSLGVYSGLSFKF